MMMAGYRTRGAVWLLVVILLCIGVAEISAFNSSQNQPIEDNPLQLLTASCATFCTTEVYNGLDLWLSLEATPNKAVPTTAVLNAAAPLVSCMTDYSVPGNPLRHMIAHMRPQLAGIVEDTHGVVHLPLMWSNVATAFACVFAGTVGLILGFRSGSSLGGASKHPYPVA